MGALLSDNFIKLKKSLTTKILKQCGLGSVFFGGGETKFIQRVDNFLGI